MEGPPHSCAERTQLATDGPDGSVAAEAGGDTGTLPEHAAFHSPEGATLFGH